MGRSGGVAHGRAVVRVANRAALEKASCECYQVLRTGRERVARTVQRRGLSVET